MLEDQCQGTCQHDRTSEKLCQFEEMAKHINKEEHQSQYFCSLVGELYQCLFPLFIQDARFVKEKLDRFADQINREYN